MCRRINTLVQIVPPQLNPNKSGLYDILSLFRATRLLSFDTHTITTYIGRRLSGSSLGRKTAPPAMKSVLANTKEYIVH